MRILITIVLLASVLTGCYDNTKEVYELKADVRVLTAKVQELEGKIAVLEASKPINTGTQTKRKKNIAVATPFSSNIQTATEPVQQTRTSSSYSGQCQAITKKGTQCSRRARSNGYCWQHGG